MIRTFMAEKDRGFCGRGTPSTISNLLDEALARFASKIDKAHMQLIHTYITSAANLREA